ncbi:hypothetical protein NCCP1664_17670 [Zafaria cholistanensis]|uniref:Uncharacterized protein n=1 Tax=Zafaria cholistanensis TaxID=1682741 RepID=A0A5A7NU31_9MICC|nr:hypothetical protein NCCP1664_17670 [Zafaria cholistanensis]
MPSVDDQLRLGEVGKHLPEPQPWQGLRLGVLASSCSGTVPQLFRYPLALAPGFTFEGQGHVSLVQVILAPVDNYVDVRRYRFLIRDTPSAR